MHVPSLIDLWGVEYLFLTNGNKTVRDRSTVCSMECVVLQYANCSADEKSFQKTFSRQKPLIKEFYLVLLPL